MISIVELNSAWDAINPQDGQNIGRRADTSHPLDIFVAYDENHNMQMILLADFLPALPTSSQQIIVRANHRKDGKYALCFSLTDNTLREQYVSLCWDIMNCTYDVQSKAQGIKMAIKRFCMWQKLFAELKNKKLSDAEIKGLIGELCALKHIILQRHDPKSSVAGWIGPIGADRDFELPDTWYETKAVSLSRDSVSISSLDQLDVDASGYLLVLRVEKTSDNVPDKFSLNSLVDSIRSTLSDEDCAVFNGRLASGKYDRSDPRADEPYLLHGIEIYVVNDGFPRIRRSITPTAIANGTYSLSIPAIQNWRVE